MNGLIYKIACDITNKCYVGQTINSLDKRIRKHILDSKTKEYPLYRAIRKYGWKHFKVEIVENDIPLENLNDQEIYWGEKNNALAPNGYSLKLGGANNTVVSDITRNKMSKSRKGKTCSEETCKKMSEAQRGNKKGLGYSWSEEQKRKLSETRKGIIFSEEHKRNLSKSRWGCKNSRSRKILCYNLEGNFIKEYDCIRDASRELNLNPSTITGVCRNRYKYTGNYIFKYND